MLSRQSLRFHNGGSGCKLDNESNICIHGGQFVLIFLFSSYFFFFILDRIINIMIIIKIIVISGFSMNYFCWTVNKQISYPHPLMLIFLGTYRGELPRHLLCPHNLMLIFGSSLIINPIFAFTHSISGSALRLALRSITREEIHVNNNFLL